MDFENVAWKMACVIHLTLNAHSVIENGEFASRLKSVTRRTLYKRVKNCSDLHTLSLRLVLHCIGLAQRRR